MMKTNNPPIRRLGFAAVLALPFLTPAFSFAQAEPYSTPAPRSASTLVDRSDREFLEEASESGLKEVTIAQAVLPRLANPAVRTYAEVMISQHSQANKDLRALAEKKGVVLPVVDPNDHVKEWGSKTKGADEDFLEAMIDDHEDAIDRYENATRSKDADIVVFAQKILPSLRRHLMQAEDLKKTLR